MLTAVCGETGIFSIVISGLVVLVSTTLLYLFRKEFRLTKKWQRALLLFCIVLSLVYSCQYEHLLCSPSMGGGVFQKVQLRLFPTRLVPIYLGY